MITRLAAGVALNDRFEQGIKRGQDQCKVKTGPFTGINQVGNLAA
jgi:hypothetical protein